MSAAERLDEADPSPAERTVGGMSTPPTPSEKRYLRRPGYWTDAQDALVVATMRQHPHITTARLLFLLEESCPTADPLGLDTFRHVLCDWIYPRYPDIGVLRRAGSRRGQVGSGTFRKRAPEVLALLEEARKEGRYATQIEPYLTPVHRSLIERLSEDAARLAFDPKASVVPLTHRDFQRIFYLLRRLRRCKAGGPFAAIGKREPLHPIAHQLWRQALARGATREEIMQRTKMNATERAVVAYFVEAERPPTWREVAEVCGKKPVTVMFAAKQIICLLQGRHRHDHLLRKYKKMSDQQIRELILAKGAASRREVRGNMPLCRVAQERGILDEIFTIYESPSLSELRKLVKERLQTVSFETLVQGRSDLEVAVLKHRVLSTRPQGMVFFGRAYAVRSMAALQAVEKRLVKKLQGRAYTGEVRDLLHKLMASMGKERRAEVMAKLKPREIELLQRRILAEEPMGLIDLGVLWGVTRERVRQIEMQLYIRINQLVNPTAGAQKRRKGPGRDDTVEVGSTHHDHWLMRQRALLSMMAPEERLAFARDLRLTDRSILVDRILAAVPVVREVLAQELNLSMPSMYVADKRLAQRLLKAVGVQRMADAESPMVRLLHILDTTDGLDRWIEMRALAHMLNETEMVAFRERLQETEALLLTERVLSDGPASHADLAARLPQIKADSVLVAEIRLLQRLRMLTAGRTTVPLVPPPVMNLVVTLPKESS